MKKTSKATIALLFLTDVLIKVNAVPGYADAIQPAKFLTTDQATKLTGLGEQGRIQLQLNPVYQSGARVTGTAIIKTSTDDAGAGAAGTTSCLDCIKGTASGATVDITSVWCSAAWNYSYISLPITQAYPAMNAVGYTFDKQGGGTTTFTSTTANTGDLGSCCYAPATMTAMVNTADTTAGTSGGQDLLNKWTCPARFSHSWIGTGTTVDAAAAGFEAGNWWCSDGSYQLTVSTTYGVAQVASSFLAVKTDFGANKANDLISTVSDRRNELMFASCRQRNVICGESFVTDSNASTERAIAAATGFSAMEKCTWSMSSSTKAPTFKIYNTGSATQLTNIYDVVYQEFIDGWNGLAENTHFSARVTDATNASGGVIYPHIPSAVYSTAAKYNYAGFETNASATNNEQGYGGAFVLVKTSKACAATDTLATNDPANCIDGGVEVKQRWFSANEGARGVKLANELASSYNTAKTSFNTLATTYNTYLTDLTGHMEKSTPKDKPTLVMRPNAPTKPFTTYDGLQHWSAAKQTLLQNNKATGLPAWNTDFVAGNNNGSPGWGSWTISRIGGGWNDAAANFISHSFGLVGVSQGATLMNTMSYVKNTGIVAFQSPLTVADLKSTHTDPATSASWAGNIMCTGTGTPAESNKCIKTGTTALAVNARKVYLNVSVWSAESTRAADADQATGATTYSTAAKDFKITFFASTWGDDSNLYAPAALTDPTVLSTPASAKALFSSAVAVLVVATSLF